MTYFEKVTDEDLTKFELSAVDDEWVSYFMAECSRLAYHDATRAKRHYKRIGFTTYKFFDVEGAQCHIAQNKELVIISFRGTEPKQWTDIKADLNAFKGKSRTEGMVHKGFKGEIDKLWADISVSLQRIGDRKLYICGHSLGGAMATICASRLEDKKPSVYTYGSPRVGGNEFVKGANFEHYRHVNNNDVVPRVPFWIMGFRHHGDLTYINHYGNIRNMTPWQLIKDKLRGRWAALKKFEMFDGVRDHDIGKYSNKLKDMVKIEPSFEE